MKLLKTFFLSTFVTFSLLLSSLLPLFVSPAYAQTQDWKQGGVCTYTVRGEQVATIQGIQCLIANILSVAITGIGLAGFVMLLVGGFRYMLSGGNSKGMEGGRNTITFAIIGLVVALSAFIILQFVSSFTGVQSILKFQIPTSEDRNFGSSGAE